VNRDFEIVGGDTNFQLQPNDEVVVRTYAAFEKQRFVELKGEVVHPGTYALVKENESIASVVQRAGGFTPQAFKEGIYLMRRKLEKYSSIQKEDFESNALRDKVVVENDVLGNQILQKNDIVYIPKLENEVYININNTRASRLYPNADSETLVGVPFTPNKSAKWYINNYAGGFGDDAQRSSVTVLQPNGAMIHTSSLIFRKFPKVKKGSTISIGSNKVNQSNSVKERLSTNKGVIINLREKENTEVKSIEKEQNE